MGLDKLVQKLINRQPMQDSLYCIGNIISQLQQEFSDNEITDLMSEFPVPGYKEIDSYTSPEYKEYFAQNKLISFFAAYGFNPEMIYDTLLFNRYVFRQIDGTYDSLRRYSCATKFSHIYNVALLAAEVIFSGPNQEEQPGSGHSWQKLSVLFALGHDALEDLPEYKQLKKDYHTSVKNQIETNHSDLMKAIEQGNLSEEQESRFTKIKTDTWNTFGEVYERLLDKVVSGLLPDSVDSNLHTILKIGIDHLTRRPHEHYRDYVARAFALNNNDLAPEVRLAIIISKLADRIHNTRTDIEPKDGTPEKLFNVRTRNLYKSIVVIDKAKEYLNQASYDEDTPENRAVFNLYMWLLDDTYNKMKVLRRQLRTILHAKTELDCPPDELPWAKQAVRNAFTFIRIHVVKRYYQQNGFSKRTDATYIKEKIHLFDLGTEEFFKYMDHFYAIEDGTFSGAGLAMSLEPEYYAGLFADGIINAVQRVVDWEYGNDYWQGNKPSLFAGLNTAASFVKAETFAQAMGRVLLNLFRGIDVYYNRPKHLQTYDLGGV